MRASPRMRGICRALLFFFQAEDGIRDIGVTGVQTCALPILGAGARAARQITLRLHLLECRDDGAAGEAVARSEEGRVGEEGRCRWSPDHLKKKNHDMIWNSCRRCLSVLVIG